MDIHKELLKRFIKDTCIKRGSFTLASGRRSCYYLNLKNVTLDGPSLRCIGECFLDVVRDKDIWFDSVSGVADGGIPLIAAFQIQDQHNWGRFEKRAFYVLKQPKQHGMEDYIQGRLIVGDKVLLLEDVVTTGGSVMEAIRKIQMAGGHVVKVISIVDRLEGGQEKLKDYNYTSIFTIKDFGL